jgi:hypothetical protein
VYTVCLQNRASLSDHIRASLLLVSRQWCPALHFSYRDNVSSCTPMTTQHKQLLPFTSILFCSCLSDCCQNYLSPANATLVWVWSCFLHGQSRLQTTQDCSTRGCSLLGWAFVSERRLPQTTLASCDSEFVMPTHSVKVAPSCFAGSRGRRSPPRPRQISKEENFGVVKIEDASWRCHANCYLGVIMSAPTRASTSLGVGKVVS